MSNVDIHELAAAYALDAVDERERAEFEAHYATCAVCRPDVAGYRETLSHVARVAASTPPHSLKADVMAQVRATRQLSPLEPALDLARFRQRRQRSAWMLAAAAVVLLVAAGAFLVGRQTRHTDGFASAAAEVLGRPDARVTDLAGTGTGGFKVAWSASAGRVVVIGNGLADPGAGKAYELWQIDANGPHAMRLLDPANGGHVQRVLDVDGSGTQWAVTVEPRAGVDAPTGAIIFSGTA